MKRGDLADERADDYVKGYYGDPEPAWPSLVAMGLLFLALAVFGGLLILELAQTVWEALDAR